MNITNADKINEVLFEIDPMDIKSGDPDRDADLADEYEAEAEMIAERILTENYDVAVRGVFNEMFWEDCISDESVVKIVEELKNI